MSGVFSEDYRNTLTNEFNNTLSNVFSTAEYNDSFSQDSYNESSDEYNSTFSDKQDEVCKIATYFIHSVMVAFVLTGFIGNIISLILWSSIGFRKGWSGNTLMLICLSISDSIFIVTVLIIEIIFSFLAFGSNYNIFTHYLHPYLLIYVWPIGKIAQFCTIWFTALLCVHRYRALTFPFSTFTKHLTSIKSCLLQISIVIISGSFYNLPLFWEYYVTKIQTNPPTAKLQYSWLWDSTLYNVGYATVSYFVVLDFLPLSTTTILTVFIIRLISKSKSQFNDMDKTNHHSRKEQDTTRSLVSIVVIFIVCKIVPLIQRIYLAVDPHVAPGCGNAYLYIQNISFFSMVINSSVNVFVYWICSTEFKNSLKAACRRRTHNSRKASSEFEQPSSSLSTLKSSSLSINTYTSSISVTNL